MATTEQSYDLSKFKLTRILYNNSKNKTVCVLGNFASDPTRNGDQADDGTIDATQKQAIVILEKTAFTNNDVCTDETEENDGDKRLYFSTQTKLKQQFVNDIYGNFECFPNPDINKVKATIICPATEKHITKYATHAIHIIQETPEIYENITAPRLEIDGAQFTLNWVYNILNHEKEVDRIIFEDPCKEDGFILLPDLKWDGKTVETLYLVAIVHRHNLKSIRSLTSDHLPLLRNIRDKGIASIKERYGISRSHLRIYFHYQPSFYHLHVHFTYLKHDAPGIFCEKSHLLDTVINNIELMPDYYQKATLSFVIKESDAGFSKYNLVSPSADAVTDDTDESPLKKKPRLN